MNGGTCIFAQSEVRGKAPRMPVRAHSAIIGAGPDDADLNGTAMTVRSHVFFRLWCALAALMCGAVAQAEVWMEAGRSDDYVAYGDPSSVKRDGEIARMWSMFDYKTPQTGIPGKTYLSIRRQFEYDCKHGKARILTASPYAANQAKGPPLLTETNTYNWRAVVPDSVDDALLKFACRNYGPTMGTPPRK